MQKNTDEHVRQVLYLAFVILSCYTTKYGLGSHYEDLDLTLLPEALRLMPVGQFFAVLAVAVSKSSFILTLIRLVMVTWQKAALWFMLVTINVFMLSIAIVQFYQCSVPPTPGCVPTDAVVDLGIFAAGCMLLCSEIWRRWECGECACGTVSES